MDDMLKWLPYYYKKSKLANEVFDVIRQGVDKVKADIAEQDKDLFITTTDSFDLHEKDVGITPNSEISDAETRRANVIAKLRGSNVLTVDELKRLVSVYEPTGIEVIEDYSEYTVILDFAYREGQPKNINEILAAIEEVKPAHIRIGTNYVRNPIGDIHLGGTLHKSGIIPFMSLDITRSMNPTSSICICGTTEKYSVVTFKTVDAVRNATLTNAAYTAGVIQTEKTIDLEVSNG